MLDFIEKYSHKTTKWGYQLLKNFLLNPEHHTVAALEGYLRKLKHFAKPPGYMGTGLELLLSDYQAERDAIKFCTLIVRELKKAAKAAR